MVRFTTMAVLLLVLSGAEDCSTPSTYGATLMQVHSDVSKSAEELLFARAEKDISTAAVARHAQNFLKDAQKVAAALGRGLEGIKSAVHHFEAEPPAFLEGVTELGSALIESIDMVIGEDAVASWPDYGAFCEAWLKGFQDAAKSVEDIKQGLERYAAEGNVNQLIAAISVILSKASDMVLNQVPGDLGKAISALVETLNKAFAGIGEALSDFEDGQMLDGLEALYWGLRNATDGLLDVQDNAIFSSVLVALDTTVSDIAKDVLDFQQRLMSSGACWKSSLVRNKRRPNVCPEEYIWDGGRHCWPKAEAVCWEPAAKCVSEFKYRGVMYTGCIREDHDKPWCAHDSKYKMGRWSNCEEVSCNETSLLSWGSLDQATSKKQDQQGTLPASCDDSVKSAFPEKTGGWCYAECPEGYSSFGAMCWTRCEGAFPADSSLMCGKNSAVLARTVTEMLTVTLRSAWNLLSIGQSLQMRGVDAESMARTVQILIDMGKPFALPKCSA